jgi:hypothetical protein
LGNTPQFLFLTGKAQLSHFREGGIVYMHWGIATNQGDSSMECNRDGSSAERAIVINAVVTEIGIAEEYAYISRFCAEKTVEYKLDRQTQISKHGRDYDVLKIRLKDGSFQEFWFDITSFYGRF